MNFLHQKNVEKCDWCKKQKRTMPNKYKFASEFINNGGFEQKRNIGGRIKWKKLIHWKSENENREYAGVWDLATLDENGNQIYKDMILNIISCKKRRNK